FGISRFAEAEAGPSARTSEGLVLGTPFYMPPEQTQGVTDLDARADVYALGVILYEALAGRRPFEASSMAHLVVLIHEGKAPPLPSLRPEVPIALGDVIAHAMAADRNQRCPDARSLGEALERFVSFAAEALDKTQLAPVEPSVAETERTVVGSATLEPRSATLGDVAPANPSRGPWLAGAAAVIAVGLALRIWSGARGAPGHSASTPTAPPSPSVSGVSSSLPAVSVVTSAPSASSASSVASGPIVPSASAPSVPVVVTGIAVASPPKVVPSSSGKAASSGSSKSQQAGLSPDL
ncbi:MAG: protein kinase, partial [Myxococcales bacterium]|nr:protein kinase [Myxococcales bacterium]